MRSGFFLELCVANHGGFYVFILLIDHRPVMNKRDGSPNHPFRDGFYLINHPFWGTPIDGTPHIGSTNCNSSHMFLPWKRSSPGHIQLRHGQFMESPSQTAAVVSQQASVSFNFGMGISIK